MSAGAEGPPWEEIIVAERMAADREFRERVHTSSLSNQAWSLVMMAVEFEVVNAENPDQAHFAVNSENLESVLPAMDEVETATGFDRNQSSRGGLLDTVRSWLGDNGSQSERREEAERLAGEYATVLQRQIQQSGKWNAVCEMAADHG